MNLVATTYDLRGEPVRTEVVRLADTRLIDVLLLVDLRLGLEVSIVTTKGRVDYRAVDAEHRPAGWGTR